MSGNSCCGNRKAGSRGTTRDRRLSRHQPRYGTMKSENNGEGRDADLEVRGHQLALDDPSHALHVKVLRTHKPTQRVSIYCLARQPHTKLIASSQ
eukprot:1877506-Rhodomonas_salina.1